MARKTSANGSKRRGVCASRIKLEHALAKSDLPKKTQAALADRIADIEELEAAPKDLINKAFRERPVDPATLERIAHALGVKAESLYLDTPSDPSQPATQKGRISRRASWGIAVFLIAVFGAFLLFPHPSELTCTVREAIAPPNAATDRLGLMITRFGNDPNNAAQDFLATSLTADPDLAPYLSILLTCARPHWGESGDFSKHLAQIREDAQTRLARSNAHLVLWGKRVGDDIVIRFVSTRNDASPVRVEISGRPFAVREAGMELRLPFGQPSEGLADLKRLILDLMTPADPDLADLRNEAARRFTSSIEWLRSSIINRRNLRRAIDPNIDPRRWAAVHAQLCYELRLLGDYDADPAIYREALEACNATLKARPKDLFPQDWASTQIDTASTLIRLHYYTQDQASAIAHLTRAETALLDATSIATQANAPQLWVTAQRNLGTAYLRLGELHTGAVSSEYFDRALALLKAALEHIDPNIQPLDWAITQQNICLAQYQHAARRGVEATPLVRDAKNRCKSAQALLSPDKTPLNWAMVQNNLAVSTAILAQFEGDVAGLRDALQAFSKAQTVYSQDRLPGNWAEVELNLGELNCNLAKLTNDPASFRTAATHLKAARDVFATLGNGRYHRYAKGLLTTVAACQNKASIACSCQP